MREIGTIIWLVMLILAVAALVSFALGLLVGTRSAHPKVSTGITAAIVALVYAVLLIGVHSLSVSGTLVVIQTLLLIQILTLPLIIGFVAGLYRRRDRNDITRYAALTAALLNIIVLVWFERNIRAVVTVAKEAGLIQNGVKYEPEKNKACPDNLTSLYNALTIYAQDWDALPPAANWLDNDDLTSKIRQNEWLHCPAVSNRQDDVYGYAYNEAVAGRKLNGKKLKDLPDSAKTPLLYDSTNLAKSAHDAVSSLPKPGRHSGRNNILYLDGHVENVAP